MKTIKEILIERDNMTEIEADELIADAKREFDDCISIGNYEGAEAVMFDYFGLEPDYLFDLM